VYYKQNGQNIGRCTFCEAYQYCVPKHEIGEAAEPVSRRPDIKPAQRVRILDRDHHTCISCHAADRPLHIGHLLSVDDGRKLGATDNELWSDENLAAVCDECNLGFGRWTVSLRLVYRILQARLNDGEGQM
jgi:hypothetical protein